jgi:hypothetical protein
MRHVLAVLLTTIIATLADDLVVLKHGNLRGHRLTSRKDREIFAFQGIPYARPPDRYTAMHIQVVLRRRSWPTSALFSITLLEMLGKLLNLS